MAIPSLVSSSELLASRFPNSSRSRDVVVIGASAGGFVPLLAVLKGLPADLAASVLVVVHIPADRPSRLPFILEKAGGLLSAPVDESGEGIRYGRVYVGAPGRHLTVGSGRVRNARGRKVGRFRPSIDRLFRSAARAFGRRVVGIVLSGILGDGSRGLRTIQQRGGTTIVQDPSDSEFGDMPRSAIEMNCPDYCVAASDMAPLILKLIGTARPADGRRG